VSKSDTRGIGMTSLRTRERLLARLQAGGIHDFEVLGAIRDLPRHLFVDEALASRAYEDTALPIGCGQTISQPFVVARMTQALRAGRRLRRVLEIGTGCGYQSAVLAHMAEQVFSVERIEALLFQARERFHALGINNIRARHGDGYKGWPEHATFDGIIITAAPEQVPSALLDQLAVDAWLVAPVGAQGAQRLLCVNRSADGFEETELDEVSFVPMIQGLQ
jgi:protein-L-isoaspartate(D-aspartate) O-methyltransferase